MLPLAAPSTLQCVCRCSVSLAGALRHERGCPASDRRCPVVPCSGRRLSVWISPNRLHSSPRLGGFAAMQRAYLGRYWWVNHRQPRHEIGGSYLWSPKRATNGSTNVSCDNMTRAVPGDVVFSHAEGRIGAVGLVIDRVRTAPTPVEFEATAPSWQSDAGWLLPVRFESLPRPLRLKDHMTQLAPVLPRKDSPIRTTGVGKKVYLAELPSPMAEVVRELLARAIAGHRARNCD